MPDISMCLNMTCPLRTKCYRFLAEPSEFRQTYAEFDYKIEYKEDQRKCSCFAYWPIKNKN